MHRRRTGLEGLRLARHKHNRHLAKRRNDATHRTRTVSACLQIDAGYNNIGRMRQRLRDDIILWLSHVHRNRASGFHQLGDMIGNQLIIFDEKNMTHGHAAMLQRDRGSVRIDALIPIMTYWPGIGPR